MPIFEGYTLYIKEARLGFPTVIVPKPQNDGPPRYNCNFILDPTAVEWGEMGQIVQQLATDKWGDHAAAVINMIKQDKRLRCWGNGSEKINQKTMQVYEGFFGNVYISASSKVDHPPKLYGQNAQELPPTANKNQMFVGGNYGAGIISFWAQENEHGRAIRANLDGVQYIREGEKFGAEGPDVGAMFQPVPGAPAPTAPAPMGSPAPTAPAPAPAAVTDPLSGIVDPFS